MATDKLEVCKLPRFGKIVAEHVQVGVEAASFGSIELAIIGGIRKTCLKNRWIK
jgi:hypothetical protein